MKKIVLSVLFVFIGFGYGMAGTFEEALKLYNDKNYEAALKMFEDVCKAGDNHACKQLARIYVNGPINGTPNNPAIKTDYKEALELFTLACNRNDGEACGGLAYLTYAIERKTDVTKLMKLYEKSCNLNYGTSCTILGNLYINTKEYEDYTKAKYFLEKGCSLKNACGCFTLGTIYLLGRGVKKDDDKVKFYDDLSEQYGSCESRTSIEMRKYRR